MVDITRGICLCRGKFLPSPLLVYKTPRVFGNLIFCIYVLLKQSPQLYLWFCLSWWPSGLKRKDNFKGICLYFIADHNLHLTRAIYVINNRAFLSSVYPPLPLFSSLALCTRRRAHKLQSPYIRLYYSNDSKIYFGHSHRLPDCSADYAITLLVVNALATSVLSQGFNVNTWG